MKLESNITIDGKVVEEVAKIREITIYSQVYKDDTTKTLYLTRQSKNGISVIGIIEVKADCGQNTGYISNILFKEV